MAVDSTEIFHSGVIWLYIGISYENTVLLLSSLQI